MLKEGTVQTRVNISKELYIKAQEKANKENRSYSNYVVNLIEQDIKESN